MERNATKTGLRLALIFKFLRFCLLNRFLLQFEVPDSKFIGVTFASVNIRAEGYRSEFEGDYGRFRAELRSKGRENDIKIKNHTPDRFPQTVLSRSTIPGYQLRLVDLDDAGLHQLLDLVGDFRISQVPRKGKIE